MACDFITSGRLLECKSYTGGLKNAYFAPWLDYGFGVTNSELTSIGTLAEVFKFELKNTGNVPTETETASRDNGTIFYDASIELVLTGLSAPLVNQAKLLSRDRMVLFLEDNMIYLISFVIILIIINIFCIKKMDKQRELLSNKLERSIKQTKKKGR
jgi:hypothetical protein